MVKPSPRDPVFILREGVGLGLQVSRWGRRDGDGGAALTQCGDGPQHGAGKRTVDKGLESVAPGKW